MSDGKRSAGRRLSVITIDQAIAGASNVLIAVLAARLLDTAAFGLFGIVFLAYMLVQGISRALVCDPLLVHPEDALERRGEVIGTAVLLSLALAVVTVLAGVAVELLDRRLGDALVVFAICVPLLVCQDLGRYLGFAGARPGAALALDVAWLVLLFAGVVPLFVTNTDTLAWFIAAWGGSGAIAGLLLFQQHPLREIRLGFAWLRYTWGFSWRYLISYTSTRGAALAMSGGVGAISGAKALGAVQGALVLVRPFTTFQVAAIVESVSSIARTRPAGGVLRRRVVSTSTLTIGVAVVNAIILLVLPDGFGKAVLGDTWDATKPLLLATGVQLVTLGAMTGVRAALLGIREIRRVMAIDIATTVVILVASIIGAFVNDAKGALWAVAIGQGLIAVVWWVTFWGKTAAPDVAPLTPATAVPTPPPA